MTSYDAIIVGAGPAGVSTSIYLSQAGFNKILLIEQKKFSREKLCGEFISPECLAHFDKLGVLEKIKTNATNITETILYSRNGSSVVIPSNWFGTGSAVGLSRSEMDSRLLERAREVGIEVMEETHVTGLVTEAGQVRGVTCRGNSSEYKAPVTVDATGRGRVLSKYLERLVNIKHKKRAKLIAFKAHLENTRGAKNCCELYFYKGGYGGLSPIENGLSNLCYIVPAEVVKRYGSNAEEIMHGVVTSNKRALETLSKAHACSKWLSVAIDSFGSQDPAPIDGLISVGDAAAFVDPFTGSGILMALDNAELAAKLIASHLRTSNEALALSLLRNEYKYHYARSFNGRLRLGALLRKIAFGPHITVELAARMLNISLRARYKVVKATRYRKFSTSGS
jgi:menaquinone-9 beta-reductase